LRELLHAVPLLIELTIDPLRILIQYRTNISEH